MAAGDAREEQLERLRDAEERQRLLLGSLPDTLVALYDRELRCVLLQGSILSAAAIDPRAYVGRPIRETLPPEQVQQLLPLIERALDGDSGSVEYHSKLSGLTYDTQVAPFHAADGSIAGAFAVARDITDRVRAERALAQAIDGLEDAQRMARLGSWSWNPATDEVTWSPEMFRIFGRDPAAGGASVEQFTSYVHPADRADVVERISRARAGGPVSVMDFRIITEDGSERMLHALTRVDGEAGRYRGSMQDVTELRAAEREARAAHRRFAGAIASAPIGMALIDLHGRYLEVNDALCAITGYSRDKLLATTFTAITHPDDLDRDRAVMAQLIGGKIDRCELEKRYVRPSGEIVWVSLHGTLLHDDDGRPRELLAQVVDIGARKRYEGQLEYLADHDALTGLFNRRRFEEDLVKALARADRHGEHGAVLMIDIDGFKLVNDTMGHAYGDELITRIGSILRTTMRETDTIARLGGDEFAAVLESVDADQALTAARKLVHAIEVQAMPVADGQPTRVTASIGITTYGPGTGLLADELIVEADIAMYDAKDAGKNRAALYGRERRTGPRLAARESWVKRLQTAADDGRLELLAQPLIGLRRQGIPRFELLLRLRGDDGELIAPGRFLSIAERFHLIQQLDRWVFAEAVRLLSAHEQAGNELVLSVNMSGKTLSDPLLLADIRAELARTPVPARRLVVEVTETAAIVNIERARNVARGLRELGCEFALDDFGAGFASFYYLKHLEFDYLKIDGEFVRSLTANVTDQLVVQSVVQIAQGLGAQTVAEFVGDQMTVDRLATLGVDFGQGYFLGRPGPVAEMLPPTST